MQPRAVDLDSLKSFPFFSDDVIKGLKDELPVYLSKCTDTDPDSCPLEWWKKNSGDIATHLVSMCSQGPACSAFIGCI